MDLVILIVGLILFITVISIVCKDNNPGLKPFDNIPSQSVLDFLNYSFDISRDDCKSLRFDGLRFYHEKIISIEDYQKASIIHSELITVYNKNIAHKATWKYQCLDGSPDLRYNNNDKLMISEQFKLRFFGKNDFILYVFSHPDQGESINCLVSKVNILFQRVALGGYEQDLKKYCTLKSDSDLIDDQIKQCEEKLIRCRNTVAAVEKLISKGQPTDDFDAQVKDANANIAVLIDKINILKDRKSELLDSERNMIEINKSKYFLASNNIINLKCV
ncbi:hypothetical protein JYB88_09675 [Shewanella cyperi]|uniref:Uncharacterized protein n=1 Tax=Shewanella cyperi TaxID=2814292 RepID=A0A975AIT2_9GAMM|nr:hypothetical protein [Shewanella cyperi]QSX28572.1 hypothetical protein JYB88_09675 [Shewanella cyperi]